MCFLLSVLPLFIIQNTSCFQNDHFISHLSHSHCLLRRNFLLFISLLSPNSLILSFTELSSSPFACIRIFTGQRNKKMFRKKKMIGSNIFDPKTEMDSIFSHHGSSPNGDFGSDFNLRNFSSKS